MAVLFVSDLHLDAGRPALTELFTHFLAHRAGKAEALYILGDLFEAWIGDDDPAEPGPTVARALGGLRERGVPIYLVHGNRDFLLGEDYARRAGLTLLGETTVIDLHGTPTLVMHGDTLCSDDRQYQQFRAQVRQPQWQRQVLARPLAERRQLAQQLRADSRTATGSKETTIMDVNPDTVAATMRDHGVRQLIHGHTHRPAIHDFELDGQPARRIVLGDWYEQGSVLVCDDQGCRLEGLTPD